MIARVLLPFMMCGTYARGLLRLLGIGLLLPLIRP